MTEDWDVFYILLYQSFDNLKLFSLWLQINSQTYYQQFNHTVLKWTDTYHIYLHIFLKLLTKAKLRIK